MATKEAFVSELIRQGYSDEQAQGAWQFVAPDAQGMDVSAAVDLAMERMAGSGSNPFLAQQAATGATPEGFTYVPFQPTSVAPTESPEDALDRFRQGMSNVGFADETVDAFVEEYGDEVAQALLNGATVGGTLARYRQEAEVEEARLLEANVIRGSDVLDDQARAQIMARQTEDARIEREWGEISRLQQFESVRAFFEHAVDMMAEHGNTIMRTDPKSGTFLINLAARFDRDEIGMADIASILQNDFLMESIPNSMFLQSEIFPAPRQMVQISYGNQPFGESYDGSEIGVTTVSMNPVLFETVLARVGGDPVVASKLAGGVHRALSSDLGTYGAFSVDQFEQILPAVAVILAQQKAFSEGPMWESAMVGPSGRLNLPGLVDEDTIRNENFDLYRPSDEDGKSVGPLLGGPEYVSGGMGATLGATTEVGSRPMLPDPTPAPWLGSVFDRADPGFRYDALGETTTRQFAALTEQYNGFRELAYVAMRNPELAEQIYENDGPADEAQLREVARLFGELGQDGWQEAGFFMYGDPIVGDRTYQNMFNVGGESGAAARAAGRTVTANVPDPDQSRQAYRDLYRSLLLAEPSDAQLSAFVASIESDAMANASSAAAAVTSAAEAGTGHFFKTQDPVQSLTDNQQVQIIKQFGVDVRASAYAQLEASEAYKKLYRRLPTGMDPLEYAAGFGQEASRFVDASSETALAAQRRGMMIGGAEGMDVTAANAMLSEEGRRNEGNMERWARAARVIAEYF